MKLYPSNDKLCEWMDGLVLGPTQVHLHLCTLVYTDTPFDTCSDTNTYTLTHPGTGI